MWRAWVWVVRLSLAFSAVCFLLWMLSHGMGDRDRSSRSLPAFLESGRRLTMRSGFMYLNVSRPPSSAEQDLIRQMDDLQAKMNRHEVAPPWTIYRGSTSRSSGDAWLVFGWNQTWTTRQVGPYGRIVDRRTGVWISLGGGILLGLVPRAITWGVQARRRRVVRRRELAGLCVNCGYDLRESRERCPECGMAVAKGML